MQLDLFSYRYICIFVNIPSFQTDKRHYDSDNGRLRNAISSREHRKAATVQTPAVPGWKRNAVFPFCIRTAGCNAVGTGYNQGNHAQGPPCSGLGKLQSNTCFNFSFKIQAWLSGETALHIQVSIDNSVLKRNESCVIAALHRNLLGPTHHMHLYGKTQAFISFIQGWIFFSEGQC